jgi:hypothetical protein
MPRPFLPSAALLPLCKWLSLNPSPIQASNHHIQQAREDKQTQKFSKGLPIIYHLLVIWCKFQTHTEALMPADARWRVTHCYSQARHTHTHRAATKIPWSAFSEINMYLIRGTASLLEPRE